MRVVLLLVVLLAGVALYVFLGSSRFPDARVDSLEQELVALRDERDALRSRNEELDRENSLYKGQLARDFAAVGELATRAAYRPLDSSLRKKLVSDLKGIRAQHEGIQVKIKVVTQVGNPARHEVAGALADLFNEAGLEAEAPDPAMIFSTGVLPDVSIRLRAGDVELAESLATAIGQFVPTKFSAAKDENLAYGEFVITIAGDPLFDSNGVVTFR